MSGGQMMVVLIVAIVMVASIIKAKYGYRSSSDGESIAPEERGDARRLREEVKELKERLHVLERIATDRENSLARQIDELRDR